MAWLSLIGCLAVSALAYWQIASSDSPQVAPTTSPASAAPAVNRQVAEFSLTERDGSTVTRAALRGRVWIADFIFSQCGSICPVMTRRMRMLDDELKGRISGKVLFVCFSVDPARDTPSMLREYATKHKVSRANWLFLTGDKPLIYSLARNSFGIEVQDALPGEDQILHSSRIFLVDGEGRIRGSYAAITPNEEENMLEIQSESPMPEEEKQRLIADLQSLFEGKAAPR